MTNVRNRFWLFLSDFWPYMLLGFLAAVVGMALCGYIDAKNNFGETQ